MRDLEIRGAGNLLGAAQSGHMEAVGYELYCKMLSEAIRTMKGGKPEREELETNIDLQVDAFIPASYIKSEYQKLDMYKRIAALENEGERSDMEDELVDRFGRSTESATYRRVESGSPQKRDTADNTETGRNPFLSAAGCITGCGKAPGHDRIV